ncbi:class I SAM-dependent methyltransferase [Alkalimarinus alittae]|uniref:Class I SAM-dependent methyltransferase n=1 Tax=Alkalimarinus alittae TaxID=2961619 RepID=A0ABY6N1Z4_9ALTE|nr:class I SAM-dependent methyltransferase [Alkalimarinus alittae]UZE96045.1 class I SAM-dependent methyltransferase [Alkalimarinus alittae]
MKPIAESCLRNQQPIAEVLSGVLNNVKAVLELGSGTGQHGVYLAQRFPHLTWQPSDLKECLPGMRQWWQDAALGNLCEPIELDVTSENWPTTLTYDAIFTANTLHFVSWRIAEALLVGAANILPLDGILCIYGPFNENGQYTGEGNRQFDQWLKARDPESGIKEIERVEDLLANFGLALKSRHQMPANNLMLVFQ